MRDFTAPRVAIVDYGVGNIFSIRQACKRVGLDAVPSSDPEEIVNASGVILPGVGAFGSAAATLASRGLSEALGEVVRNGIPLMGICLGFQLLMRESYEFGCHRGLGLIDGDVVPLRDALEASKSRIAGTRRMKVPRVGWGAIEPLEHSGGQAGGGLPWQGTLLASVPPGSHMYFVHSYFVRLTDPAPLLAISRWGDFEYCSAIQIGALFGCQFHPERSGQAGLLIYAGFGDLVRAREPTSVAASTGS